MDAVPSRHGDWPRESLPGTGGTRPQEDDYGCGTLARQMVRQDWGAWHLDAFLPMLYNNFYEAGPEWVKKQTQEGVAATRKPVYSGLFIHNTDADTVSTLIDNAIAGGASGVSFFP